MGIKHLIGMATVGLLIYAALSHMRGQSREKNDRIIKLAALAIPVVEFARHPLDGRFRGDQLG